MKKMLSGGRLIGRAARRGLAKVAVAGLWLGAVAARAETTGNVTWSGGGGSGNPYWNVGANWVGGDAPPASTPGILTFPAAAHSVTSVIETDRSARQLDVGASGATVTHTIDLGNHTLTITNLLRAGQWWQNPIATLVLTNGTLNMGALGAAAVLTSQRGLISFNRQGARLNTVNLANIRLLDGAYAGATLDLRNVQVEGDLFQSSRIEVTGRDSLIQVNDSITGSVWRVTGSTELLPLLGTAYIGDPGNVFALGGGNVGRFPAGVAIELGVDAAARGNAYIGRASPHGTVRCAIAVAPGGGGSFSAYLTNLRLGYSEGNDKATYGVIDVAAADSCLLDVVSLLVGMDRSVPNPVDNFNGTLRLPPGAATVANAVIGGNTAGLGTLSLSNTVFAVTNSLTLNKGARVQIATGSDSKGVDVDGAFSVVSGSTIATLFMEQPASGATNWAVRVKGDHATTLNSMIGAGRLTWSTAAGITGKKAGVLADDTYTYFALVDDTFVFEPFCNARDTTFEIMADGVARVDVSEVNDGSFDPDGRPIQMRLVYDGGPQTNQVTFSAAGDYSVTLVLNVLDGNGDVIATATDLATVHVVLPTPTSANVEWTGQADTLLNTGRREWYWSGNWSGNAPPANPTLGTVYFRTLGQLLTGIVETDRAVHGLSAGASGAAVSHTINLGGNTLTVTNSLSVGFSQSQATALAFTNGTLQLGTDQAAASVYAVMSTLNLFRSGVGLETRNVRSITTENAPWDGASIDLRGVQFVNNTLKADNVYVRGRFVRGIMLNSSASGCTIRVPGTLRMWMDQGNGSSCIGDPQDLVALGGGNLWRLPAGVSVFLGTDAAARGNLEVARATPHGALRGGIVAAAGGGGTFTAYLSTARIGYSEGGTTAAYGIFDMAAMDSCLADVASLSLGPDRSGALPADNFNGILRLPSGTATVAQAVIGGATAGKSLLETSNTVFAVTGTLTLNKTATVTNTIASVSSGLDLANADSGALSVAADARLVLRFLEPAASKPHYGLRWAGDHQAALTDMADDGRLVIDDAGLGREAAVFVTGGYTYVGLPPAGGTVMVLR